MTLKRWIRDELLGIFAGLESCSQYASSLWETVKEKQKHPFALVHQWEVLLLVQRTIRMLASLLSSKSDEIVTVLFRMNGFTDGSKSARLFIDGKPYGGCITYATAVTGPSDK